MKVINLKKPPKRIQDFIHWYHLQSHMNSHEKESIHPISLSPNISSLEEFDHFLSAI